MKQRTKQRTKQRNTAIIQTTQNLIKERTRFQNLQVQIPYSFSINLDACPYCRRVQRKIDELRISDKIEMRDTRTEPKWRKDLKNRTGRTQVPCLFIDGTPMFESLDIIDFLQNAIPIDS